MLTLPDLSYDYSALEPHIDAKTMEVHHSKHHQGYVDKTNAVLEGTPWADKSIEEIISNLDELPDDIRGTVRNVGGGVANHNLFWTIIGPDGGGEPEGELKSSINECFGGFEEFKKEFSDAAGSIFGSGWVWLVAAEDRYLPLRIMTTQNQDSPLYQSSAAADSGTGQALTLAPHQSAHALGAGQGLHPLLTLDVWEHAYYLKYQNRRPEYIDAWWEVVDWGEVGKRFKEIK
ncbi:superoxide dismutase [Patescibacteria group bacterium]|nr:superoxide dismutase [Patescibacteria group bacterium]MBU1124203.1 superoxide dismutase [Patescibacteria group bacterium]